MLLQLRKSTVHRAQNPCTLRHVAASMLLFSTHEVNADPSSRARELREVLVDESPLVLGDQMAVLVEIERQLLEVGWVETGRDRVEPFAKAPEHGHSAAM